MENVLESQMNKGTHETEKHSSAFDTPDSHHSSRHNLCREDAGMPRDCKKQKGYLLAKGWGFLGCFGLKTKKAFEKNSRAY